jgi:hypothetical protein
MPVKTLLIQGKIIDQQSQPLAGAKVRLWKWEGNQPKSLRKTVTTDKHGQFEARFQKPARGAESQWRAGFAKVFFIIVHEGKQVGDTRSSQLWSPAMEGTEMTFRVALGEGPDIRDKTTHQQFTILGRVVDSHDQKGLVGIRVQALGSDKKEPIFRETETQTDGAFRFTFSSYDLAAYAGKDSAPLFFRLYKGKTQLEDTEDNITWAPPEAEEKEIRELLIPVSQGEERFLVHGKALTAAGDLPASEVWIEVINCTLAGEFSLDLQALRSDGSYRLVYRRSDLEAGQKRANLIVKALDADQTVLVASPLIVNALPVEEINLVIGDQAYRGIAEFERVDKQLGGLLPSSQIDQWNDSKNILLVNRTGLPPEQVQSYVSATKIAASTGLDPKFLYAIFRRGVPLDLAAVYKLGEELIRRQLAQAITNNIIREVKENWIQKNLDRLEEAFLNNELEDKEMVDQQSSLRMILKEAGLSQQKQQLLLRRYSRNKADVTSFWKELRSSGDLRKREVDKVQLALQLNAVSLNHAPMVKRLLDRTDIEDARQLAGRSVEEWEELIGNIDLPKEIAGEELSHRKRQYAETMQKVVTNAFPTATLTNQWNREPELQTAEFSTFFTNNPDFDFRSMKVSHYVRENSDALRGIQEPEELTAQLRGMRRLFQVIPGEEKYRPMQAIWRQNIRSAYAIAQIGEAAFVRRLTGDVDEEEARTIYRRAQLKTSMSLFATAKLSPAEWVVTPQIMQFYNTFSLDDLPDWETLFGSLDFCACKHCRSLLSPAAYFVDLLQFLREADAGLRSAFEELLDEQDGRRPDLGHILLNCANTNTAMPYIDLVNEILENAVVNDLQLSTHRVPQTNFTSAELRANPEHIREEAYTTLSERSYPWTLPFNLWHEERKVYLDHLQIQVSDLMDVLHREGSPPLAIDRAAAYFGMTDRELTILQDNNPAHGLGNSTAILNILRRSGLSYEELNDYLALNIVNPNGRSIAFEDQRCALASASLEVDSQERESIYQALYHTYRLQSVFGWELPAIDEVITAFDTLLDDNNPTNRIIQSAYLDRLLKKYRLSLQELLSWWMPISTRADEKGDTFYEKIFLNKTVTNRFNTLPLLRLNPQGTELAEGNLHFFNAEGNLEEEIATQVLAGINLSGDDLRLLIEEELENDEVNLSHLSYLYRVASFCRAIGIAIRSFRRLKQLTQVDPLAGPLEGPEQVLPERSWNFIQLWEQLQAAGLSVEELAYVLMHQYDAFFTLPLSEQDNRSALQSLQGELSAFGLAEDIPMEELLHLLRNRLPAVLSVETTDLDQLLQIIAGASELEVPAQTELIETYFVFPLDPGQAVTNLVSGGGAITNHADRIRSVLEPLLDYLSQNRAVQLLSELTGVDLDTGDRLLRQYLQVEVDADERPALSVFIGETFLNSDLHWEAIADAPPAYHVLNRFSKLAFILNQFQLSGDQLTFVLGQGPQMGWYPLLDIPYEAVTELEEGQLDTWLRLVESLALNRRLFSPNLSLFAFLEWIIQSTPTQDEILEQLSEHTGWAVPDLQFLCGSQAYSFNFPGEYRNERWIGRLEAAFKLIAKAGVTASQLWQWNVPIPNLQLARQIRNAAKAKYSNEQWLDLAPKLTDTLRIKRRDALRDYLLAEHANRFNDVFDLYEHFLIDPEVNPCFMTSRIKQAISSVQLFVQRINMGLEANVRFDPDEVLEWEWRKNYRVWEANRKVFLYPENWIQPELRDDKTPFFRELENTLLQEPVNDESVEKACLQYLRQLDQVARLEIAGVYMDETEDVLHIFAHTKGDPPQFYYRQWVDKTYFTAWEKVNVKVDGRHVLPVVYNRRLMLIWMTFQEQAKTPSKAQKENHIDPETYWHITLNWSEYRDGGWSGVRRSAGLSTKTDDKSSFENGSPNKFYFYTHQTNGELYVVPFYHTLKVNEAAQPDAYLRIVGNFESEQDELRKYDTVSGGEQPSRVFRFNGCAEAPEIISFSRSGAINWDVEIPLRTNYSTFNNHMKFGRTDGNLSMFTDIKVNGNMIIVDDLQIQEILKSSPYDPVREKHHKTLMTPPHQYLYFQCQSPFFFEDHQRTFFVIPGYGSGSSSPGNLVYLAGSALQGLNLNRASLSLERAFSVRSAVFSEAPQRSLFQGSTVRGNALTNYYGGSQTSEIVVRPLEIEDTIRPNILATTLSNVQPVSRAGLEYNYKANLPDEKTFRFQTFYHPYTCLFIKQLNRYGIDGLLSPGSRGQDEKELFRQLTPNPKWRFSDHYSFASSGTGNAPIEAIDFKEGTAYSQYNWEIFFHIPMMLADRLTQDQKFADAQRWYHYVFDPLETNTNDLEFSQRHRRFWKIKPFFQFSGVTTVEEMLQLINEGDTNYEKQIARWEADPFNPHLIARLRIVTYMKFTVMKYLDNLIAWGDNLFRRDTIESINEATQLYVLAAEILGRKPEMVNARTADDRTYRELEPLLDELSNAIVPIENEIEQSFVWYIYKPVVVPKTSITGFKRRQSGKRSYKGGAVWLSKLSPYFMANPGPGPEPEAAPVFYFCLLPNDKMLDYWDVVADRLFKIRNCMNIEGVTRSLALFAPPIDPALLVKAAAAGLDLGSALNALNAPMVPYRFNYVVQKALELCNDVRSLGGALLAALEKKDGEVLALLRAEHESQMLAAISALKEKTIEEAIVAKEGLEEAKQITEFRKNFYRNRPYNIAQETAHLTNLEAANRHQEEAQAYDLMANIAFLFPDLKFGAQGISSPEVTFMYGGSFFGKAYQAFSKFASMQASKKSYEANRASIKGGYDRRQEEWDFQAELADKELAQIEKQIQAADIRRQIAELDLSNHEKQIARSEEVIAFFQTKYTNQELYQWMCGQIAALYFQSYQMAYDLAKKAEKCMQFELSLESTNFIQFGYWDSLKKGLLAGERLTKDIRRMEIAYLEQNRRDYEIHKPVSLLLLNPQALLQLKSEGTCTFDIPELLYDLDFPGQYFRRIKSVSVTIPCVTGPYTTVSAKLTLLRNRVRSSSIADDADAYRYTGIDDPNFRHNLTGIQAIATSNAQQDSGLFELNFRDERYLPFEGAGAISSWRLEFPTEFPAFDYATISDAIIHIRYTAREGGDRLRDTVNTYLRTGINRWLDELADDDTGLQRLFNLRQEFPQTLHHLLQHQEGDSGPQLQLQRRHFPSWLGNRLPEIDPAEDITILVQRDQEIVPETELTLTRTDPDAASAPFGTYQLEATAGFDPVGIRNVFMLVTYRVGG